jgi:DNA mismatch endonuclease (patch repair protein)
MMSGIRGKDTLAERCVRSYLHRAGLRFRINDPALPGRPDIVFPRYATVVFVHGCFWHRHPRCPLAAVPKTRRSFWLRKFASNVEHDRRTARALRSAGWRVLVLWECQLSTDSMERLFFEIVSRDPNG